MDDRQQTLGQPERPGPEELLSVGEAALRYGVPARKINKMAYDNQLDGHARSAGRTGSSGESQLPS